MSEKMEGIAACENTDRHLWPQVSDDPDCPKLFVTKGGGIGINVSGHVIVKPLSEWHKLASVSSPAQEPVTTEPVAWIVLSRGEDNIRIWWRDKERAEKWSKEHDQPLIPLALAIPAPPQLGREWPEGDKVGIDPDLCRALAIEECAKAAEEAANGFNQPSVQRAAISLAVQYIRALPGALK